MKQPMLMQWSIMNGRWLERGFGHLLFMGGRVGGWWGVGGDSSGEGEG